MLSMSDSFVLGRNWVEEILLLPYLIILSLLFLSLIGLYFTLDRRFGKKFKGTYEVGGRGFWIYRISHYAQNVVFPDRTKKVPMMADKYQGFNFRTFSTQFEVILSYILLYSFLATIIITVGMFIADWLGYLDIDKP